jgi:hypothetical protein
MLGRSRGGNRIIYVIVRPNCLFDTRHCVELVGTLPDAGLLGALTDPAFPGTQFIIKDLQAAAHTLGLQLIVVNARTNSDAAGTVLVAKLAFIPDASSCIGALCSPD